MPMTGGRTPSLALTGTETTDEGIEFSFTNVMAPLFTVVAMAAILTFSLTQHSALPWLLALLLPLFWIKSSWAFCYRGPTLKFRLHLFGVVLWSRRWVLTSTDSASADLIPDSIFLMQRPQWYKLTIWSSTLQRDHVVMRSNDPEDLARLVGMLNDAIKKVCATPAS